MRNFYSNFSVAFVGRKYQVLENTEFLPRFSLIYDYAVVNGPQEALNRILSSGFKPGDSVFLEEDPGISMAYANGEVSLIKNIANEKILSIKSSKQAFLIVRENYHPDWKCYIDGKQEKVYKSNYIFYGVFIPEGKHEVRFVYESKIFNISCLLSFIGFLCFLGVVASFIIRRK